MYDQLIYVNSAGKVTPGLAESILPAFSFTQWTIKLRPNLKFTDGTPLNADAVVAHFDRIRNPATASPARPAVLEIAKTKIIDQQTIQVTLNDVDSSWNMTFTQQLGNIPSPTAVSAAGAAYGTSAQTAVGAGPFKIVEFVRGDHYTFERNPGYYDAPKPYLDKVIIRPVADHSARYNTFTTGGADMVEYAAAVQQMVDLRAAKYPTATTRGSGIAALALRTDTGPTADVRVREALQRAIDIDAVIARAAPGAVKAESIPDPDGPWANDIPYPGFDRVKAQSLIDAYLKDTNQSSVTLKLIGANTNIPVWEAFKQEWDKIKGLNVVLQIEESAATGVRIATRNYSDMLNSAVPNMPRTVLPAFSVASSSNLTFVKDIPLDVAVGDANATGDPAVQRRAMQAFSKRLAELVPYVLQYRTPFNFFWQKNVQGVELGIASGSMPMQNVWKK